MSENLVPENSDFSYLQILLKGGLTIPSINFVNCMCTAFGILNYSVDASTQFELPPRTAAGCILCHFSSDNYEQCAYSINESIGRCFYDHAAKNVFFSNKRKLSIDSTVADCVKEFRKRQREM